MIEKEMTNMDENKVTEQATEQNTLDFWKMKNLSTCEYDSAAGNSAWAEWDIGSGDSDDD